MPVVRFISLLFVPILVQVGARAQSAAAVEEVRLVVQNLFDGMRAGDSTAVRAVFHPGAELATAVLRDTVVEVVSAPVDRFVTAVGTPHDEVWDERIFDVEIRVDGPLASVWAPYRFYRGEQLSHCGVNSFTLVQGSSGWLIHHIIDTRRRERCDP